MNIMEMIKSKKFKVMICSILALVCSVLAEQITYTQAISAAWPIIAVYLASQGLADMGKGTAKIAADTPPADTSKQ